MSTLLYTTAVVFYQRIYRAHAAHELADRLAKRGLKAEARFVALSGAPETVELSGGITRDIRTVDWDEAEAMFAAGPKGPVVRVQRLTPTATLPTRGSPQSAGLDLYYDNAHSVYFRPGDRHVLSTGIALTAPEGTYARIAPRSGLAMKGLDVLAGVVDEDYTGEVKVILAMHGAQSDVFGGVGLGGPRVEIKPGDKIAQVIFERCVLADVEEVELLGATQRGAGGFGSTGR